MTAAARVTSDRRAMLAKVHLAAKDMGLDDDGRRDVIERVSGHRSSADCSDAQLAAVLTEYRRLGWKPTAASGFKPRSKARRKAADTPVAGKARAMWISLWNLGVVRDPSDRALEAFARRQLKVDSLQWADTATAFKLIEALKKMAERVYWDQATPMIGGSVDLVTLKTRLVVAQWGQLRALLGTEIVLEGWRDLQLETEAQIDDVIKRLGQRIRQAQAEATD